MKYTPNPPAVVAEMLQKIEISDIDELFADIPARVKLSRELNLGSGLSELALQKRLRTLADKNITIEDFPSFLGAGAYDHFIPAAIDELLSRSEFYTAYTPYQAEISQGLLQAIFEYQTMICGLTGMEVSNASLYDGATALAEACNLACEVSGHKKVLLPSTLHPEYIEVVKTYALSGRMEIVTVPQKEGVIARESLLALIDKHTAAVVMQQPNFFGCLEDLAGLAEKVHANKGLFITVVDPISLGLLKSPSDYGADIVVGEGQTLGNPLSFGGPYLGFMATTRKYMRKIPGRIVGQTIDEAGQRSFVLTLQAREQHIRREKASSNICSNHNLNAMAATIYLSLIGPQGLKAIAIRAHHLAVYAREQFLKKGFTLKYTQPFWREFAIKIDNPTEANALLLENGIIGGYELEDGLLLAFTEKRTRQEIDQLVAVLGGMDIAEINF
jgi:glycine dehydrogenase subunit 1